ncbi:hypothetical protein BDV27DRAFT_133855 [Aspergillus caelatus]|uniref:Uncharacterized protein n=1 Tax=Aspergillus caelatus TaxID=61420 RepID=A0A5N6ZTM3_9EURO|nr:uncharacterized protein BDV27DRAFT_133855 [Aspergillus caelatus]KAE8360882.1 hypothetical protein BDV27DRAFT_133855 [Aspergillus caelatus]
MLIYKRDGGCCCLMRTPFKSYMDHNLEYVQMISTLVFSDPDFVRVGAYDNTTMPSQLADTIGCSFRNAGSFLVTKDAGELALCFLQPATSRR